MTSDTHDYSENRGVKKEKTDQWILSHSGVEVVSSGVLLHNRRLLIMMIYNIVQ